MDADSTMDEADDGSESEYVPSEDTTGSDTPEERSCKNSTKNKKKDQDQDNEISTSGCSKTLCLDSVAVKLCTKKEGGGRIWDKKNFCIYCGKGQSKLARHLERKHFKEIEVAQALGMPKGSKDRHKIFDSLRNKGNYHHNIETMRSGTGQIVTVRRPSEMTNQEDYLPCQHCLGFFKKKELWKHDAVCAQNNQEEQSTKKRKRVQAVSSRCIPMTVQASEGCKSIILNMHVDDVSLHIRTDPLICKYGDMMFEKHGHDRTQNGYISQKMRELGRFMLAVKAQDPSIKHLGDVCVPTKFKLAMSAAKATGRFDQSKKAYDVPSLPPKIGFTLKRVCEIIIGESLMNDDAESGQKAQNFIKLLDTEWNTYVSRRARTNLEENKWNKSNALPLTEDVITLQKYLKDLEDESKAKLKQNHSDYTAWHSLSESVLAQIIIFNRRRQGEAAKLLVETFQNRNTAALNSDVMQGLSKLEQDLSEKFTRLEIRGKRGRKVPVLLTDRMCSSVDLLIETRSCVGVPLDNPYIFANGEGDGFIRGSDCLRKCAHASHAKFPELLTSTKLRKQVATLCQIMNLKKNEMDQVAKFLGHDIRVHREYYRLSENTIQLTKMSKLLLAIEQGTSSYKGKSLDEIDLDMDDNDWPGPGDPIDSGSEADVESDDQTTSADKTNQAPPKGAIDSENGEDQEQETPKGRVKTKAKKKRNRREPQRPPSKPRPSPEPDSDSDPDYEPTTSDMTEQRFHQAPQKDAINSEKGEDQEQEAPKGRVKTKAKKKRNGREPSKPRPSPEPDSDSDPGIMSKSKKIKPSQESPKSTTEAIPKRRPWTPEEKQAVWRQLGKNVTLGRLPGKKDCDACLTKEKVLSQRSWKDVKNFVYNSTRAKRQKNNLKNK